MHEYSSPRALDPAHFRTVLGQLPTGVVIVTATGDDGSTAGLTVGSFTSVSIDPPLVAFLPQVTSGSWRRIEATGSFCVNVLTHYQEHVCRTMASRADDKFSGLDWRSAESGSPVLDGVSAWIDCDIETVHQAGDHYIVIGRVRDLDVASPDLPLVFYQGGYGRFAPSALAANDSDLIDQLVVVDVARPQMEALSTQLGIECMAIAQVDTEVVVIASSGAPRTGRRLTRVGTRVPFVPPAGYVFAAWSSQETLNAWLDGSAIGSDAEDIVDHRRRLARVRHRGFSVGLGGPAHVEFATASRSETSQSDPDRTRARLITQLADDYEPDDIDGGANLPVRTLTAPIFGKDGSVVLAFVLYGLPATMTLAEMTTVSEQLLAATGTVSAAIGGVVDLR